MKSSTQPKITVSNLRAESARLIAENKMPSLDELLLAISSMREKFVPKILAARKEKQSEA